MNSKDYDKKLEELINELDSLDSNSGRKQKAQSTNVTRDAIKEKSAKSSAHAPKKSTASAKSHSSAHSAGNRTDKPVLTPEQKAKLELRRKAKQAALEKANAEKKAQEEAALRQKAKQAALEKAKAEKRAKDEAALRQKAKQAALKKAKAEKKAKEEAALRQKAKQAAFEKAKAEKKAKEEADLRQKARQAAQQRLKAEAARKQSRQSEEELRKRARIAAQQKYKEDQQKKARLAAQKKVKEGAGAPSAEDLINKKTTVIPKAPADNHKKPAIVHSSAARAAEAEINSLKDSDSTPVITAEAARAAASVVSNDKGYKGERSRHSAGSSRHRADSAPEPKEHRKSRTSRGGKGSFSPSDIPGKAKALLHSAALSFTKENPYYDPQGGDYVEVNGKSIKNKPRRISPAYTARNFGIMILALIIIMIIYIGAVIITAPKIDPKNIYDDISQTSTIYADDGKKYDTINSGEDRELIKYSDLPKNTVNAFVALEDKTFWTHHGFNWIRMAGAVRGLFTTGSISGTSTITQQLARNVYLPKIKSQRSVRRKVLEMYYAAKIESSLSKQKIFEAYVNSIYFGYGNYGIQTAARTYFSKDVKDLTLEESAALASLPQSPDSYALIEDASTNQPNEYTTTMSIDGKNYLVNDLEGSRRRLCLQLMADQGYISKSAARKAQQVPLTSFIKPTITQNSTAGSYFTDYMTEQVISDLMKKYNITYERAHQMVYSGGLKIYSTIDRQAQAAVEKEFSDPSNFPTIASFDKDANNNIIDDNGNIIVYAYNNIINADGNFVFGSDEYKMNNDGSITILKNHRLNIYKTQTANGTDYSLEFKNSYINENGTYYVYPGGYINIPAKYKKLDSDGNLIVSADFLKSHKKSFDTSGDTPVITNKLYTMQDKVVQPQGAMVITEVGTGEIKAMVGGRDIQGSHLYNRAVNTRQPGSSIKPLSVYSTALQQSYDYAEDGEKFRYTDPGNDKQGTKYYGDYLTAASIIVDEPLTFSGKVWPKNSNNRYTGRMTMRKALAQSTNTVAVKLYEQVGGKNAAKMAKKFGLSHIDTKSSGGSGDTGPQAIALGGLSKGATPLEMAQAYATFPNGGVHKSSIFYTKVIDSDGHQILTGKSKSRKVIDSGVAYIMTDMLKTVVKSGTGRNAAINGQDVGGKTGTTNDNYDIWFDGFTAKYAASLWIGNDVNLPLTSESEAAASLWSKVMRQIPGALGGKYKSKPADVVKENGEYFTKGTETGITKSSSSARTITSEETTTTEESAESQNTDQNGSNNNQQQNNNSPATPTEPIQPNNPSEPTDNNSGQPQQ